jgi:hypothetical protein
LVYNSGIGFTKEHATMVDGNGLLSVAKKADISERNARRIMEEVKVAVKKLLNLLLSP